MGFLDRLLGRQPQQPQPRPTGGYEPPHLPQEGGLRPVGDVVASEDARALARYRYLLRTAPPERLEQVHAEAFAQLSPSQRHQLLTQLGQDLPAGEAPRSDDPRDLARAATRAEMQRPGYLQGAFGGGGMGMGSTLAGSMMGTIAGVVVGSAIADSLFGGYEQSPEAGEVGEQLGDPGGDSGDLGSDLGGDPGGDVGGGGLDDGGFGGDLGGDFGGGDFGGGDFGGFGDF